MVQWRNLYGWITAALVVIFMIGATFISQLLQSDYHYAKPVFITYVHTSFLVFLGVIQYAYLRYSSTHQQVVDLIASSGYTPLKLLLMSIPFSLLWFSANFLYTLGLPYTTIGSVMSLEQSSTVFVFILSIFFLYETITIWKLVSTVICIGGVIVVAFSEPSAKSTSPIFGNSFIIASTISTSLYMVFYAKYLERAPSEIVPIFLSFIGISNILLYWPLLIILHYTQMEIFVLPTGNAVILLFIFGAIVSLLFNLFLNLGILLVSPLFMRFTIMSTIPVSFLLHLVLGDPFNWVKFVGAIFICIGFTLFTLTLHVFSADCDPTLYQMNKPQSEDEIDFTSPDEQESDLVTSHVVLEYEEMEYDSSEDSEERENTTLMS